MFLTSIVLASCAQTTYALRTLWLAYSSWLVLTWFSQQSLLLS